MRRMKLPPFPLHETGKDPTYRSDKILLLVNAGSDQGCEGVSSRDCFINKRGRCEEFDAGNGGYSCACHGPGATPPSETTSPPTPETTSPPTPETTSAPAPETTSPPTLETTTPLTLEITSPPTPETTSPWSADSRPPAAPHQAMLLPHRCCRLTPPHHRRPKESLAHQPQPTPHPKTPNN